MAVRKPIPFDLMAESEKLSIVDTLLNEPWSPIPLKAIHFLTKEHKLDLFDKLVEAGAITYEGYTPPQQAAQQEQPEIVMPEYNTLSFGEILAASPHAKVKRLLAIKEEYPDTPIEMLPERIQVEIHEVIQTIMMSAYIAHQTTQHHDDTHVGQDRHCTPVSDVIGYLVKHGHADDRVTQFAQGYLQNLEIFINKIRQDDVLIMSYTSISHTPNDIHQGRALLNGSLYRAMIARTEDFLIPPLALYILSVAQRDGSVEILLPYLELRDRFEPWCCDLRLMSVNTAHDLVNEGRNLVIVALVGTNLHIRIFDANGKRVVDKADNELMSGDTLTMLKKQLNPLPYESRLSQAQKQKIIQDATSIAGHTLDHLPSGVYFQGFRDAAAVFGDSYLLAKNLPLNLSRLVKKARLLSLW